MHKNNYFRYVLKTVGANVKYFNYLKIRSDTHTHKHTKEHTRTHTNTHTQANT